VSLGGQELMNNLTNIDIIFDDHDPHTASMVWSG
jgi:hypothetical protein